VRPARLSKKEDRFALWKGGKVGSWDGRLCGTGGETGSSGEGGTRAVLRGIQTSVDTT
jgi:hypothetical protein